MSDLLINTPCDGEKKETKNETALREGLEEFIYFIENGESLVDVAAKFSVPCDSVISDNELSGEPLDGYALVIRLSEKGKILLPEEIDEGQSADSYNGVYPFKIIKK